MDSNQAIKNIIWDYNMTPDEFLDLLHSDDDSRDKKWAMARLIERADYYTTMKLIGKDNLKKHWDSIKSNIRFPHIIEAYDYVLSR